MSKLRPPSLYPQVSRSFVSVPLYCDPAQWWRPPLPCWMSVSVRWWPPGKSFRASAGHLSSLDCALFTSNIARISRHCHHGLFRTFLYLQQSTNKFFDSLIVWCVVCRYVILWHYNTYSLFCSHCTLLAQFHHVTSPHITSFVKTADMLSNIHK